MIRKIDCQCYRPNPKVKEAQVHDNTKGRPKKLNIMQTLTDNQKRAFRKLI